MASPVNQNDPFEVWYHERFGYPPECGHGKEAREVWNAALSNKHSFISEHGRIRCKSCNIWLAKDDNICPGCLKAPPEPYPTQNRIAAEKAQGDLETQHPIKNIELYRTD